MNIRETFLKLTQYSYPHGTESDLEIYLPEGFMKDKFGNYFYKIGQSRSMFTCHLDTVSSKKKEIIHRIGRRYIETDGKTNLGADDKAGMTILLYMIENKVPGLYYFFIGEEVGCIGSNAAAQELDFTSYDRCISFDRRGYDSVITEQIYGVCCSDEFGESLSEMLNKRNLLFNFSPDPTGMSTDSASFMEFIPECTNISVGYFNEHSIHEFQDIVFLENMCKAVIGVNWETLPVVRDPSDYYSIFEDEVSNDTIKSANIVVWVDKQRWCAKLTSDRIIEERSLIYSWVFKQSCYNNLSFVNWDGKNCEIEYDGISEQLGDRQDLMYIIPELETIPLDCLDLLYKLS